MPTSNRTAIALAVDLGFAAIATLAILQHWRHLFWVVVVCFALVGWTIHHLQLLRGRAMSKSQNMMIALAGGLGMYGTAMLAMNHDWRDGLWAFGVCLALVWGAVEHRSKAKRAAEPDLRSQLWLS